MVKAPSGRIVIYGLSEVNPLDALDTWGSSAKNVCGGLPCQTRFLKPDTNNMRNGLATVIMFGILAPDMLYSKRVANTFVNR
jgi:hypothetical protein